MEFDFEKELKACEKKKRPDESICYSFGVGRVLPLPTDNRKLKKGMKEAIEYIKHLEGFQGVKYVDIWHTILIFDTLNNAKKGKNLLEYKGISTGYHIIPLLVEKKYLKTGCDEE